MLKTQIFEKKANFPVNKNVCRFFLPLSSVINLRGFFKMIHKKVWQLLWKVYDHFCNTYEVVENTNFGKKTQTFQWRKVFGLFFSHSRVWQTWGANLWVSTRCFDSYCESYKTFSVTPKRLLKTQIFEEKANFPVKKKVWPFFPNLSSVKDLSGQFMRVHKVFRQLLWKLKD